MDKELEIEVSICCAFYNRSKHVKESIDSLLNQTHDKFEVIVINDGSTDPETNKILDSFDNKRLTVVHQINSGFVTSIKNAINLAKGKYIAIHGAGDISYPNRILEQAKHLQQNEKTVAVSCYFENTVFGGKNHGVSKKVASSKLKLSASDFINGINPLSHGEVMFRKDSYERVGGYRNFFTYAQDIDLWLRMIEIGSIDIVPNLLYQRREFTSDGVSTNRNKLILQNYLAIFAKQCYLDRQKAGKDTIQEHGSAGVFFRTKNKQMAKFCALQAIECLHQDKLSEALKTITLSLNEYKSPLVIITYFAIKLSSIIPFKIMIKSLISLHPNASNWNRS